MRTKSSGMLHNSYRAIVIIGTVVGLVPSMVASETSSSLGVCEVVHHPRSYVGKVVHLHASFVSDGMEHSGLVDPACKDGWIDVAISSAGLKSQKDYWAHGIPGKDKDAMPPVDKIILWGIPFTTKGRSIHGTFIGRFEWHEKLGAPGIVILDKVLDIVEVPCTEQSMRKC